MNYLKSLIAALTLTFLVFYSLSQTLPSCNKTYLEKVEQIKAEQAASRAARQAEKEGQAVLK